MSQRVGISRRLFVACTLLLTSQALFVSTPTSASSDDPTACAELTRWAQTYEGTAITLDDFAQFDRAHRVAIFNAVSPDVRASLVQDQLRRFRQRADLSETQRALITEALTLTTPALYRQDPAAQQAHREFTSRMKRAFTSREHQRAWYDLGSVVAVSARPSDNRVGTAKTNGISRGDLCDCEGLLEDNECTGACGPGGGCTQIVGCGSNWDLTCNGKCAGAVAPAQVPTAISR